MEENKKAAHIDCHYWKGRELMSHQFPPRNFLVNKLMYQGNTLFICGDEKAGKSIFTLQLTSALITGTHLLSEYSVPSPKRVLYIQNEGDEDETQHRIKRMREAVGWNDNYFDFLFFEENMQLDDPAYTLGLFKYINERKFFPEVLIIDSLYLSLMGSLSDDQVVRRFIGNVRWLKLKLGASLIINHHTHVEKRNIKGWLYEKAEEKMFGSRFLRAFPNAVAFIGWDKKTSLRTLMCRLQRSGDLINSEDMFLIENPLHFQLYEPTSREHELIMYGKTMTHSQTIDEIVEGTGKLGKKIPRSTIYRLFKTGLCKDLFIEVNDHRFKYKN